MKITIKRWDNGQEIFSHEQENNSIKITLEEAIQTNTNLQYADLQSADLQSADLQGANLRGVNLQYANLQYANLQYANLQYANLQYADLQGANLRGVNLDFSSGIPFSCKGTKIVGDDRLFAQMIYHLTRQNWSKASGGVQETVEHIRQMAISDLFCEYRYDVSKL